MLSSVLAPLASAYEVNEQFTVEAALRGIGQYANYSNAVDEDGDKLDNKSRAAGTFDLTVDFQPNANNQLYAWARFAAGNGLNDIGGTLLAPYGGELEDDVKDINGRNRDYLLEAWYKHTFEFSADTSLGLTGGIIDSTAYVDGNEFANDADSQFMNEAFVNSANAAFPSYDLGGAAELVSGQWSATAVYMNTKNDDDRSYNYVSGQLGYHPQTAMGQGNYRLFAFTTNGKFSNHAGDSDNEKLFGFGVSLDQEFGETFGGFVRAVWANDDSSNEIDQLFSFGANVRGKLWGRPQDNAGIGYAFVNGNNDGEIRHINVGEAYVRFQLNEYVDLSLDLQYETDKTRTANDPNAWIVGTRISASF